MTRYSRNDEDTSAVGEPPTSGGEQIIATDQAAPNGNNSGIPDRRVTAHVASPVLANSLVHLMGKQNLRQFKDLHKEVKKIPFAAAGTVFANLYFRINPENRCNDRKSRWGKGQTG
jgi:hypothetical protein